MPAIVCCERVTATWRPRELDTLPVEIAFCGGRLSTVSYVRVCGCKSMPVAGETTHVRQLVVAEHGAA
jgi:hypothetical protein